MPYNAHLEDRIEKTIRAWENTARKNMFGGVCHLLNGNMFCGVYKDFLILRLGVENAARLLKERHVRPFDITGRPMKGWVMVAPEGFETADELKRHLEQARDFANTLPPK